MNELTLPYPPSANRYWRMVNGRMIVSAEARKYKRAAATIAIIRRVTQTLGPVKCFIDFYRPAKRGDLDNTLKVCIDSLKGIAFEDDSQIVEIHARRFEDKSDPRAEVRIEAAGGARGGRA